MATASVTYSFAASTLIKSAEANTNFQDLVSFLNSQVIHKDASVAFTGVPSGPATDPSADNQLVRKAYVDKLGIVAQQALTTNNGPHAASADTDMLLNNVSVVAGRTYEVHLHTQCTFASVSSTASWVVALKLNGAELDRFATVIPVQTGSLTFTIDSSVYWTPSVTAATDDLLVNARLVVAGAEISFGGAANARRTLTLIDHGVI